MSSPPKAKRDYRQLRNTPTKFLQFAQDAKQGLLTNPAYPESSWGENTTLFKGYFEKVDVLATSCHLANDGGHTQIRQRDSIISEVVVMLDQIVTILEGVFFNNPEGLRASGFNVAHERKLTARTKVRLIAPGQFSVVNTGEVGKALANGSSVPGAWNSEIQINQKNPASEADWLHKGIYPNPKEMVMENLLPGNTFFRMRHHGADGPGPWSAVVTVNIT